MRLVQTCPPLLNRPLSLLTRRRSSEHQPIGWKPWLARALGLKHRIIGANEAYYGRDSVLAAEAKAVWYATHFLSLCDFDQTAQPSQIRITGTAVSGGLHLDQLNVND